MVNHHSDFRALEHAQAMALLFIVLFVVAAAIGLCFFVQWLIG